MFTGIINYLGKIENKSKGGLIIKTKKSLITKLKKGTSIAVDGICFTVLNRSGKIFEVDFMTETYDRTNIRYLKKDDSVNLELPVTTGSFLSGSISQGHIDGISKIISIKEKGNSKIFKFSIPVSLSKYIVNKGPITINGVSLTVIDSQKNYFTVGIIPYTFKNTNFHTLKIGSYVNIEVDIIGKYAEKMI